MATEPRSHRAETLLCASAALWLLGACGGGDSGVRGGGPDTAGDVLKISYFRAFPNPQSKVLEPSYRVVLSESWMDRIGETVREPFPLAAWHEVRRGVGLHREFHIYRGPVPDEKMKHYLAKLREYGLDRLKPRKADSFNPDELNRLSQHAQHTSYTRVFTVGDETSTRSFYYLDHHATGDMRLVEIYAKCEAYILSIMNGHTIRIQTKSDPVFRKDQ